MHFGGFGRTEKNFRDDSDVLHSASLFLSFDVRYDFYHLI